MATETGTRISQEDLVHLHRLVTSFISSQAIFAGLELGVFDALAERPGTAEEVARRLGLGERAARALLLALLGDHVLARESERYANTPLASTFLVRTSPSFYGAFTSHQSSHFEKFSKLTEALRNNGPLAAHPVVPGKDGKPPQGPPEAVVRLWARASDASAMMQADDLAAKARLKDRRHLADLGCGGGAYSVALALANPHLRITAVEQPALGAIAEERFAAAGLSDRIRVRPADIFADEFPECDAALLSHVLDGYSRERCQALIGHIHSWLPEGGELLLHAHFPSRSTVPFPYQLGLILVVNNPHGGEVHDEALTCRWLEEAGFTLTEVTAASPISSLVRATRGRKAG